MSNWEEKPAVTGRENDTPIRQEPPVVPNSTLADRAKARLAAAKRIAAAENKAVTESETKGKKPAKKTA